MARPIAHRGLHGRQTGLIENSAAAARAAIAHNYAIECDVQCSHDGEAMVFHDAALERLTQREGCVGAFKAEELSHFSYKDSDEKIITLRTLLELVNSRVTLIVEIKSRYDGDMRLTDRVLNLITTYSGPIGVKSFDPAILLRARAKGIPCPLGLVAQAHHDSEEPAAIVPTRDSSLFDAMKPDFISFALHDLPHPAIAACRMNMGLPVMTWTVRSEHDRERALAYADQIIFEGFTP
ncbi:MAG TPA: glycerophosphodiester phosphodiesterase family protein [Methylocella sp.]|nr:glycerophosphodiester phosphodiesterase family protein [Methylocella sp.]